MNTSEQGMHQSLMDIGCDEVSIAKFLRLASENRTAECLVLLSNHRCRLLDAIHTRQKRIDILDYLVYTIKKNSLEANSDVNRSE